MSASIDNVDQVPRIMLVPKRGATEPVVFCIFPETAETAVISLGDWQSVKVRGTPKVDRTAIGLLECELVEAGPSPVLTVSPSELAAQFAADPKATAEKYDGKPVAVEGTVIEVVSIDDLKAVFLVGSAGKAVKVRCKSNASDRLTARLKAVQKGQTIKAFGTCHANQIDGVFIDNAKLLVK